MSNSEDPPWAGMKCSQCEGPFFLFGAWKEIRHPLCLKCWDLYQERLWKIQEQNIRGMNFELSHMEDAAGMPRGFHERYAVAAPKRTTVVGDLILNNIKVDQSAIGVLNTGSITGPLRNIDASITLLKNDPAMQTFQEALKEFTEAVVRSTEATNEQKIVILELMSAIADEIRQPKANRRTAVAKTLLQSAQETIAAIGSLHSIWQTLKPIIASIFS